MLQDKRRLTVIGERESSLGGHKEGGVMLRALLITNGWALCQLKGARRSSVVRASARGAMGSSLPLPIISVNV